MQFDVNLFVGLMHAVVLIGLLCAVAKCSKPSARLASYVSWKRGTARICCRAPCYGPVLLRRNRSISPTRRTHSSKPAALCCSGRMGQTDGQSPYRYIDPAYYAGSNNCQ